MMLKKPCVNSESFSEKENAVTNIAVKNRTQKKNPKKEYMQQKDSVVMDKVLEDSDSVDVLVAEEPFGEDCGVLCPAMRRLLREMMSLVEDPPSGVELLREEEGQDRWHCSPLWRVGLQGASRREVEDNQYIIQFHFPASYPLEPPEVTIMGDTLPESEHISRRGRVLLPVLVSHWSPAESVRSVCTALSSLLAKAGRSKSKKKDRPVEDKNFREIREFLASTDLGLTPSTPPTRGDGNCWFRAIAAQVEMADIANKPRTHEGLRKAVADHVKSLPSETKDTIVANLFKGKMKGLMDLAYRQRKEGQWVDDGGVMGLATADFLGRNIEIYGFQVEGSGRDYAFSRLEPSVGERRREADSLLPLTVFLSQLHYQSLQRS